MNNGILKHKFIIPDISKENLILRNVSNILLINCDIPSIPPLYKEFGTINILIAKANKKQPVIARINSLLFHLNILLSTLFISLILLSTSNIF
jgi:hypothetical protein